MKTKMNEVDNAVVGWAQLASTPIKIYTEDYVLLEPERINNKTLYNILDFMVFLHERYRAKFFPEISVTTRYESVLPRNIDGANPLNYVIILDGADGVGDKVVTKIAELSLVFVNEIVEVGSDYWSGFEVTSLSEEERRFVISESENFINNNDHQKVKDPFIFTTSGIEGDNEIIVQGRIKKAIEEEKRGREYYGNAYSVGARGDLNVAYLKIVLEDNKKPCLLSFLVGDELFARRAAAAYADPDYELIIEAHETIDAKGISRWHLDHAELVECGHGFDLE